MSGIMRRLQVLLLVGFCLMGVLMAGCASQPEPITPTSRVTPPAVSHPCDFDNLIQLGLEHSPNIKQSDLMVDVSDLSLSDAKWNYTPRIYLTSSYYIYPGATDNDKASQQRMTLNYFTNSFDPIRTYFRIQERDLLYQLSVLSHLKKISQTFYQIGQCTISLDAAEQKKNVLRELDPSMAFVEDLANELDRISVMPPLEVQAIKTRLLAHRNKKDQIASSERTLQKQLNDLLGIDRNNPLVLDFEAIRRQRDAGEDPLAHYDFDHSLSVRIARTSSELEKYRIKNVYTKYLPTYSASVTAPDPITFKVLNSNGEWHDQNINDDYYTTLSMVLQIWDNMERSRDISRQRMLAESSAIAEQEVRKQLTLELEAERLRLATDEKDLEIATKNRKLSRMKLDALKILYDSGKTPLVTLAEQQAQYAEDSMAVIDQAGVCELRKLSIRYLTDNLLDTYVAVNVEKLK